MSDLLRLQAPRLLLAALLLAAGSGSATAQAPAGAAPRPLARLRIGEKRFDAILVAIQADRLQFCYAENPAAVMGVKVSDVRSATFKLEYSRSDVTQAAGRADWDAAARLLYAACAPTLPFLVLPENNAAAPSLQAGTYLWRAAMAKSRFGPTPPDRRRAEAELRAAQGIFERVAAAAWFDGAESARLWAIACLVLQDRLDDAAARLADCSVPGPGDDSRGVYWLTRAQLAFARGQPRDALGDVVQTLLFDSQDLDTFPDALLLSGRCYEALDQHYRARDVYYESARLFQGTHWGEFARGRLRDVMTAGRTRAKEPTPIANVFFGIEDDVNAKADELLGLAPPPVDTQEKKEEKSTP